MSAPFRSGRERGVLCLTMTRTPWLRKCVKLQLARAIMQLVQWDDLRVFLEVQRHGSHKRAARALGVDATTIGRRITALEGALGARLFERTPEGLLATSAGRALLPRAERIESEALAAERELHAADSKLEGTLRVTAADGFIHHVLLPALSDFRREHPHLLLEFRADHRVLDLSRREADVAVRLVRPKQPALIARRLGQMQLWLFASQDYVARRGTPRSLAALAAHDWIGFDASLDATPQARWLRRAVPEPRWVIRANSTSAQVLACAEGHGIALLPAFAAGADPRLRRLMPRLIGPARELWGVTHADMRTSTRCDAFLRWLARLVASTTA